MSTEHPTSPRGPGASAQGTISRRCSGGSDSSSRDRGATRRPDPADAGRPRYRRGREGGADPQGCRVSDARSESVLVRLSCLTVAARCFVATVREVKGALSEQPNMCGVRSLCGLTVARFQRTSSQPEEAYRAASYCGLPRTVVRITPDAWRGQEY
jgi:hypothetical protein